ncbi:acetyltransferase-like isoleucine patch superfamily enzyme [Rhizobium petrolearium]|uniref:Acyltransferase n=1 Tax=Neorhizobium petrolearium TaxID=515361 RepID=A0ABY8LVD2_9HYPH|nr:acyltransferase [Neorhizobium petrolearium]MBP1848523.1 acetyltransferase-like isoleucine patch superfamily enzyme [Neorhizobium petrolearium]MCC2611067.1 acyltransferase [Neorhizobium petrolearium]WGI66284.1 acyltransferase [Neorhizobium petrolearium]
MAIKLVQLRDYRDDNGNTVRTGANVKFPASALWLKERNAHVEIGNDVSLPHCQIEVGRNSKLIIGDGCRLSGKITVGLNSRVEIGTGLNATGNVLIRAVESTSVDVGNDCLFGSDIVIRTADGHPVYDAFTRERINKSRSISIGNHVWLADRVVILKGVTIGNASAVGIGSVVTKSVGSNCVAAGNPARIVRTGVTWELGLSDRTEEFYLSPEQ